MAEQATRPADPGRRYRRNPRTADQELGGKAVILHYEGKKSLGLNETGTRIWALLDGSKSAGEVAALVVGEELPEGEQARREVLEFIGQLKSRELVEELD